MKLGRVFFAIIAVSAIGVTAAKLIVENIAHAKADAILASLPPGSPPLQLGIELTERIHKTFKTAGDKNIVMRALYTLRPYWTNGLVPSPLRPRSGAIDLIYAAGLCDTHARALNFVLEEAGFTAWQFNIVAKTSSHSISLAEWRDGKQYLFDPLYAVVAMSDGTALSPEEVRARMAVGTSAKTLLAPVGDTPVYAFYDQATDIQYAKQGEPLIITDTVKLPASGTLMLGQDDNKPDIQGDAVRLGWHTYWNYIGSRYDRTWRRVLYFEQDTKVTIATVEDIDKRFITSSPPPIIDGKTLQYNIKAGEKIVFEDGLSGREWLRLRSYQDLDYIKFEGSANAGKH